MVSRTGDTLSTGELYELLRLRVNVFVVEQQCPYPELDGNDLSPYTRHIWTTENGEVSGCLRVFTGADDVLRIGRVCTAEHARGTGVASSLLRAALAIAPHAEYVLDAQTHVADFYARFGFRREGTPFDEDGIPHITMRKPATSRGHRDGPSPGRRAARPR